MVNTGGAALGALATADTASDISPYVAASTASFMDTPNTINVSHNSLPGGTPAELFASVRIGASVWQFSGLEGNAQYTVRLYFAEINPTIGAGQREFDVKIEGNMALADFDIYNEAGGRDKGIAHTLNAPVSSDGILEIEFICTNALIAGIEVLLGQ